MEGKVRNSGLPKSGNSKSKFRKQSCYILQDDHLNPLFTVWEIMSMASQLKLDQRLSKEAKESIVSIIEYTFYAE